MAYKDGNVIIVHSNNMDDKDSSSADNVDSRSTDKPAANVAPPGVSTHCTVPMQAAVRFMPTSSTICCVAPAGPISRTSHVAAAASLSSGRVAAMASLSPGPSSSQHPGQGHRHSKEPLKVINLSNSDKGYAHCRNKGPLQVIDLSDSDEYADPIIDDLIHKVGLATIR